MLMQQPTFEKKQMLPLAFIAFLLATKA